MSVSVCEREHFSHSHDAAAVTLSGQRVCVCVYYIGTLIYVYESNENEMNGERLDGAWRLDEREMITYFLLSP